MCRKGNESSPIIVGCGSEDRILLRIVALYAASSANKHHYPSASLYIGG